VFRLQETLYHIALIQKGPLRKPLGISALWAPINAVMLLVSAGDKIYYPDFQYLQMDDCLSFDAIE